MIKVTRNKNNKHKILSASLEPKQQTEKKNPVAKGQKIIFSIGIFVISSFAIIEKNKFWKIFIYFAQCDLGEVSAVCIYFKNVGFCRNEWS